MFRSDIGAVRDAVRRACSIKSLKRLFRKCNKRKWYLSHDILMESRMNFISRISTNQSQPYVSIHVFTIYNYLTLLFY